MITDPKILITEFLNYQDVRETTKRNYKVTLNYWVNWLILHGLSWGEVTAGRIAQFRDELIDKGKSPLTINTYLSILIKFYKYLEDAGHYPDILKPGVKKCKGYKGLRKMFLSDHQIAQLIGSIDTKSTVGERDYLIINLMLNCGLRNIEICRLNVEDFKENKFNYYLWISGKGYQDKVRIRVPDSLGERLGTYLETPKRNLKDPIITIYQEPHRGDRMSTNRISMMIKARLRRSGIDNNKITAHSLRHTAGRLLMDHDVSLHDIQIFLRHTTSEMTRNYLRFAEDKKRLDSTFANELEKMISKIIHDKGQKIPSASFKKEEHYKNSLSQIYKHDPDAGFTFEQLMLSLLKAFQVYYIEAEGLIFAFQQSGFIKKQDDLYFLC